jgi:hypothetical protein
MERAEGGEPVREIATGAGRGDGQIARLNAKRYGPGGPVAELLKRNRLHPKNFTREDAVQKYL